ncbi:MAG: hypothetical protein JXB25_06400 [Deltaproteobacteria bacterium]|nr:hypothetical protein [Deltaproteobacteria bacterium]
MSVNFKILFLLALICLTSGTSSWAEKIAVSLKPGYLVLNPEGELAVHTQGMNGTKIDVEKDLNLDNSQQLMGEAALQMGSFRLSGSYLPIRFSGKGALTRSIVFKGRDYNVGDEVEGDMDIDLYDVALSWNVINRKKEFWRFEAGPELSLKIIDSEVSMRNDTLHFDENDTVTVPIPTIGVRAMVSPLPWCSLIGRLGYLEYDRNNMLDGDLQVELSPHRNIGVFFGYRYLSFDMDETGVFIDAALEGFYGGVSVRL